MQNKSFSISGVLKEGWELTKVNIGFLIVYQIILFFLIWLFGDLYEIGQNWKFTPTKIIGSLIVTLGKMGFVNSALILTKGQKPSFDQFYVNWRLLLSWIIAGFLFGIMFVLGLALLIIPGLIVWAAFGFYQFFILDKNLGPMEALKKSAEATYGIRKHVLLFFIVCLGIMILGFLCFGIGILIAEPVTLIAMAVVYDKLTGQTLTTIQPNDIS